MWVKVEVKREWEGWERTESSSLGKRKKRWVVGRRNMLVDEQRAISFAFFWFACVVVRGVAFFPFSIPILTSHEEPNQSIAQLCFILFSFVKGKGERGGFNQREGEGGEIKRVGRGGGQKKKSRNQG